VNPKAVVKYATPPRKSH